MQRAKQHGAGGRAAAQIVDKQRVRTACVVRVGIACFLREGLGVQPVQQFEVHAERAERILRCVRVQVDQTGDDELSGVVVHRERCKAFGQGGEDTGAYTIFTDHILIFTDGHVLRGAAPENIALEYKRIRHIYAS